MGFFSDFYQMKTFWGVVAPPASPPHTPVGFEVKICEKMDQDPESLFGSSRESLWSFLK